MEEPLRDIAEVVSKLSRDGIKVEILASTPKLLTAISLGKGIRLKDFERNLFRLLFVDLRRSINANPFHGCRSVSIERLPTILSSGIDVVPTNAPFYVDSLSKALEYGGPRKVLLLLSPLKIDYTFREVGADMNVAQLEELKKTFPTVRRSADGTSLWLSRLPETDLRVASGYESQYARWIPGNPFECLQAIVALGVEDHDVISFSRSAIELCTAVRWQ